MTRTEKSVFLVDVDDPEFIAAYPHAADVTVDHISDLLDCNLPDLPGPR